MGETLRGQPWTPAVMLSHGCYGLSVRRMTGLCTFRRPSMCRPVPRQLMRFTTRHFSNVGVFQLTY